MGCTQCITQWEIKKDLGYSPVPGKTVYDRLYDIMTSNLTGC